MAKKYLQLSPERCEAPISRDELFRLPIEFYFLQNVKLELRGKQLIIVAITEGVFKAICKYLKEIIPDLSTRFN